MGMMPPHNMLDPRETQTAPKIQLRQILLVSKIQFFPP